MHTVIQKDIVQRDEGPGEGGLCYDQQLQQQCRQFLTHFPLHFHHFSQQVHNEVKYPPQICSLRSRQAAAITYYFLFFLFLKKQLIIMSNSGVQRQEHPQHFCWIMKDVTLLSLFNKYIFKML